MSERAGTVTLRGTVRSLRQRRVAVEIAKSTRGVRAVEDELIVDPHDHSDDDEIRGAALQALMSRPQVPDDQIDVRVTNGWLTLSGQVKHQSESNAAFEAVSGLTSGGITNKIHGRRPLAPGVCETKRGGRPSAFALRVGTVGYQRSSWLISTTFPSGSVV